MPTTNPTNLPLVTLTTLLTTTAIIVLSTQITASHGSPTSHGIVPLHLFVPSERLQQTVHTAVPSHLTESQMEAEMLHVLGLQSKPKPRTARSVREQSSATKYSLELYNSLHDKVYGSIRDGFVVDELDERELEAEIDVLLASNDTNGIGPLHRGDITSGDPQAARRATLRDVVKADLIISFKNFIRKQRKNAHLRHNRERRFWFAINDLPKSKTQSVIDAELRVYRDQPRSWLNSSYDLQLTLFQVVPVKSDVRLQYVDRISITGDKSGWLRFNVTSAFKDWTERPKQNMGLYLQIRNPIFSKDLSPKMVGIINHYRGFKQYQPFLTAYISSPNDGFTPPLFTSFSSSSSSPPLPTDSNVNLTEIYSESGQSSRSKRAAAHDASSRKSAKRSSDFKYYNPDTENPFLQSLDKSADSNDQGCRKARLYVDFKDLSWSDWIIAPEGYAAYVCRGHCNFPIPSHLSPTNHAILQNLMHLMDGHTIPKPCCAPKELSPIMVLYFDDDSNVVMKKYKNMVVKKCSCF